MSNYSSTKQTAPFVQTNSVQSQFTALTNDKERFRREKEAAEKNHRAAQHRLQQLKTEQIEIMGKIRKAQGLLGDLNRKTTMLKQEEARLGRVMECERKSLESCATHTKNLDTKEKSLVKKYCAEMNRLCEETAGHLERQENASLTKFLSVESVEAVVLNKLAKAHNTNTNGEAFNEEFELMKQGKVNLDKEISHFHKVKANLEELRAASKEAAAMTSTSSNSQQMELFYGSGTEHATSVGA